ncbi:antitoxin Xre-like helix-turn-helix domain-containing protein [Pseudomonas sp. RP23018S]|uniref:antitoxin Xre-like helix-turn-helix domain-containing protein n=1 Tax=Pseudomonas sp. RP23018S TaxID=3096037 RepID=UPI002ACA93AF|nr:antitoxin Xre-like helix-turn-helix domain-containing protein [Pseudomonas sp. RP23018S]MDZ5602709.1 antitoxin Xre-like helix-turn-helix domain-containing protein [Pseudomonas sp. RP23018S]
MGHAVSAPLSASNNTHAIALRAAVNILEKWQASPRQIESILRISRSTCSRAKDPQRAVSLDDDQLARTSLVLNIHASLRTLFDNPDNVYGFARMANDNLFFAGRTPLQVMAEGSFIHLYETFRHIDGLRGAQW